MDDLFQLWDRRYGLPRSFCAVDTETSGVSIKDDRILNIGWCHGSIDEGDSGREHFLTIDWTKVLSDQEIDVLRQRMDRTRSHMQSKGMSYNWTIEDLQRSGLHPTEAVKTFLEECSGRPLVAHYGCKFDFPLLGKLCAEYGSGLDIAEVDLIDTGMMVKAVTVGMFPYPDEDYRTYMHRLDGVRFAKSSMKACIDSYGLDRYGAGKMHQHDAGYDAWLCFLLYRELVKDSLTSSTATGSPNL